jgi:hypothetical protein
MGAWKDRLKGLGTAIGNGVQTVAEEARRRAQIASWKKQILAIMYPDIVMDLAHERNLKPMSLIINGNATLEDYKEEIILKVTLDELITYCHRRRVPIRKITDEIDKDKAGTEIIDNPNVDENVKEVAAFIEKFNPSQDYTFELPYQTELVGWLKSRFPEAVIEKQRGSSRPDIVIRGIAIEVKGPTREQDLQTIADKCLRYSIYFKEGIIIVLFNVDVNPHRYKDWSEGLKRTHPQIIVIKK